MRAQFDAFEALVKTVPGLPAYDTFAEDGESRPVPYVVLLDQTPRREGETLDSARTTSVHTFSVLAVGSTPNEVRWAIEKTSDAVEYVRLVVPPRTSTPLKKIGASSITRDPDAKVQSVYTATDVWRCAFDRA